MKPDTVNVGQLFTNHRRYCVPIYQRQYVWTEEKQWANLMEDLKTKARARLKGAPDRHPHYMGAIVLEKRGVNSSREVPIVDVIDGQQRLTTLQLLLAAIRDVAWKFGQSTLGSQAQRNILNDHPEEMRDPDVERYKLWPTHHDREIYLAILDAGSRSEVRKRFSPYFRTGTERLGKIHKDRQPRLLQAYIYFHDAVEAFVTESGKPSPPEADLLLDAALTALRQDFRVVEIQLEADDDAQVIFETLNDRGMPLLAADLIRNYIFLRAARGNKAFPEKLYESKWKPLEDRFWSQPETRGRLTRPRMEFFLLQYLAARTGEEVSLIRLFAEYRQFVEGGHGPATVEAEVADILRFAPHYRTLVTGVGDSPLANFARRIQPWDVGTAFAPILAVAAAETDDAEREQAYTDILSYVVRRAVCGRTTKNYNNIFLGLARAISEQGYTAAAVRSYLLSQQGESGVWPSDVEFRNSWVEQPVYRTLHPVSRLRAVLNELEVYSRTAKVDPAPLPNDLWVEHLLPQAWLPHWPLKDGTKVSEVEAAQARYQSGMGEAPGGRAGDIIRRDRALHTIGNLTLHTGSLGAAIKNAGFKDKQREFRAHGLFHLTKGFTGPNVTLWDEETIRARSETLLETALTVWPHPGPISTAG